jgi:transposase
MHVTGAPVKSIVERLGVPKRTVHNWIKSGRTHALSRLGRPRIITERDKRRIKRLIKSNRETRRLSANAIIEKLDLQVTEPTLIKTLNEMKLFHRIARRRPYLTVKDRKRQLEHAKKFKDWTVDDFKRVIYTDETSFHVGMRRGSVDWIWRSADEEFHPDCIDYTKRPKNGIMFWGAFRWGKMGPGLFFNVPKGEHINSKMYRDQVLAGPLNDFWTESFLDVADPLVMEDNAPVHKGVANTCRKELGMTIHPHPPNSPDLNPIENIWAWVKYRLAKDYPYITSEAQLREAVQKICDSIPNDYFNKFIESMPDRYAAVVKAHGGSTRY